MMGVYERQDERDKVNRRFVYKGPNECWAWSGECGCEWRFGREEDIGDEETFPGEIFVRSPAPTPESIVTKRWNATDEDDKFQLANLTTTAINYKPAELFEGTCIYCVQCRGWRRCGKGSGCSDTMYCSKACQRAHLQ
jgi:hypothetical protein